MDMYVCGDVCMRETVCRSVCACALVAQRQLTDHPHLLGELHQPVAEEEDDEHQTVRVIQRHHGDEQGGLARGVPAEEEDGKKHLLCVSCVCQ